MKTRKFNCEQVIAYCTNGYNLRFSSVDKASEFFKVGKTMIYKCVRLGVPIKRNSFSYYLDYLFDFFDLTGERKRGEL